MTSSRNEQTQIFSDFALAKRLERIEAHAGAMFIEARADLFPSGGACWIEVAGAYAMFDGPHSPLTQTFGLGMFESVTIEHLEAIESFFREREAPVFHEVSPLAGLELVSLLNERGYRPLELTSVMYRPLSMDLALNKKTQDTIDVRLITDEEHAVWSETAAEGWIEQPMAAEFMRDIGRVTVRTKDAYPFLALLNQQPIATGAMYMHNGVALLAGASTVPAARRQGAQSALFEHRLRFAAERGCDIAMMCAAPGSGSQRNAERNNFRVAYTRIKWQLMDRPL